MQGWLELLGAIHERKVGPKEDWILQLVTAHLILPCFSVQFFLSYASGSFVLCGHVHDQCLHERTAVDGVSIGMSTLCHWLLGYFSPATLLDRSLPQNEEEKKDREKLWAYPLKRKLFR